MKRVQKNYARPKANNTPLRFTLVHRRLNRTVVTLSKLCNFVRAYCGQTVEVFVLPCYHSPPPSLHLLHHWSSISEQNPVIPPTTLLFSRATLELKSNKGQIIRTVIYLSERFGANTVWVDNPSM